MKSVRNFLLLNVAVWPTMEYHQIILGTSIHQSTIRESSGPFFGDRGTWTLTIYKVDGFSFYYKFLCCRYWHVEWDSIFTLVQLISRLRGEWSDQWIFDPLVNLESIQIKAIFFFIIIWIINYLIFHINRIKYRFESVVINHLR